MVRLKRLIVRISPMEIRFDGGYTDKEKGRYLESCPAGAIHLNGCRIGKYPGCWGCEHRVGCIEKSDFKMVELFFTSMIKSMKEGVLSRV
jgi:hypothetical protein